MTWVKINRDRNRLEILRLREIDAIDQLKL